MTRILFNGHDFKFLNHLIEHCERSNDYQVLMDFIPGHEMSHEDQSAGLLRQADLIFCEWALGNSVWYSVNKLPHQKLIIRLHHQEINLEFLNQIYWPNVDQIVFICPENMEIFLRRFGFMAPRTSLIYNVIDCHELDRPKLPGAAFNLGFIGTAPMRKAPHLAFEIFKKLKQKDNRFMLYFKGKHPQEYDWLWKRSAERAYYEAFFKDIRDSGYEHSVVFDPHGDDIADWFAKIGFILSTSEHEGSHQAVAEGMAAGSIPVIRNWAGADKLYPKQFVVRNLDESINMILSFHDSSHLLLQSEFCRRSSREQFDTTVIISQYERLFDQLLNNQTGTKKDNPLVGSNDIAQPKVVHVCYLNVGSQSGYEVRVIEETSALVRQGVEVFIAVFLAKKWFLEPDALNAYRIKLEMATGASIIFFPTNHFFDLSVSNEMVTEIDEALIEMTRIHDIRIMHGQALYSTMHALRVAKRTGSKVVFDVHGVSPEETLMTGGTPDRVEKTVEFEKQALKEADLKVMVSGQMNTFYRQKYGISDLPFQLVPCCVRSNEFRMSANEIEQIRIEKGIGSKFVILYLGTLSVWQWPEAMFNLFTHLHKAIPDSLLYMLIPGYDHPRAMEFVRKYDLDQDSYLLEEVPHDEVGRVIGIADAGLLLRESHPVNLVSSPTKFGEYLASGVPVILTEGIGDYSAMAERMKVGVTLKIDGDRFIQEEQDKLVAFSQDVRQNRKEWRERCANVAREKLEWALYIEQLFNKYKTLVKF